MKKLKIAYSENALQAFGAIGGREIIDVNNTDYTDVAAVVITEQDSDVLKNEMIGAFKIPVMLIKDADSHVSDEIIKQVYRVIDLNETDHDFYSRQINSSCFLPAADRIRNTGISKAWIRGFRSASPSSSVTTTAATSVKSV